MLDGQRYFSHYPDENPAIDRKPFVSTELIKTLATIEREIRECLQGGDAEVDARDSGGVDGGDASPVDPAQS